MNNWLASAVCPYCSAELERVDRQIACSDLECAGSDPKEAIEALLLSPINLTLQK